MVEIDLRKRSELDPDEKNQWQSIDKAGSGGGGSGNFVTHEELESRLDTSDNLQALNPTSNIVEPIDDCLSSINDDVVINATNITTNIADITALDVRITAVEAGGGGGGTDGATVVQLDINDYVDIATSLSTIDCHDLDSSVEILNFVYPPTTSAEMAKTTVEVSVINIAATKIKTITFAPTKSVVTSSTNKDYKKILSFFRFKLYKTTVEEDQMYATATSGRVFPVITDTEFSYTPEETRSERITYIGRFKGKYSFYFERDVLTEYTDKLFFFDANVIFSTRLDTGVYDQRFILKKHYSICLFVDQTSVEFALHSEDPLSTSDSVLPLGSDVNNILCAKNVVSRNDGTIDIETLAYYIGIGEAVYYGSFLFNHLSYVTSAFLNSGRVLSMGIRSYYSTNYVHCTYLQIGDAYTYLQGMVSSSSADFDYRNCTLKSVHLLTFRARAIVTTPDVFVILPILYMNAYFYEA